MYIFEYWKIDKLQQFPDLLDLKAQPATNGPKAIDNPHLPSIFRELTGHQLARAEF